MRLAAGAVLVGLVAWTLLAFPWLDNVACLRSGPDALRWLTITWDGAILAAYTWIPVSLVLVWLRLQVRPGGRLLVLYGLFVVLCGLTHGMTIVNFEHPLYWLAMKLKAVTGGVSLAVAYVTHARRPDLLALGAQGAALRTATARAEQLQREAEERADKLGAATAQLEESARSEAAARRQAEGLAADLVLARDQATQRAKRAEGAVDLAEQHAAELRAVNEQLQAEIAKSAAASARIEAQALAIAELETPVTPIWPSVLLCPMVGPMDSSRAGRLMERMLDAVYAHQARIVILDLTGVSVIDTAVAAAIQRAAQAIALVGAECIVTGVAGTVAVTMIGIGVTSLGIETRRDVQQGLSLAMRRLKV